MSSVINISSKLYKFSGLSKAQYALVGKVASQIFIPLLGICAFLIVWSATANNIETSLGQFPGPGAVYEQFESLYEEHKAEGVKELEFLERQEVRNAERVAKDPDYIAKVRAYTGKETFLDQIVTSLITVLSGFIIAAMIAIPLGLAIGLNKTLNTAINPIIQVFKPVSPLAWLPLVTMVVSAVYDTPDPMIPKAFLTSMITVTLCCLWPMLINTSLGVISLDEDLVNVSRVLRLPTLIHIKKVVIPASIPMIFTGMRLSLGVAWMVLIAAEMLAQNPGLGKFVWDEFQNGSSESLSRIMVAVFTIGFIGYLLDRVMMQIQRVVSWDKASASR